MKLYVNTTSPYARPVRIAVIEKGLEARIEVVVVDAWGGDPGFVAASPHERVPALVTDEGVAIVESPLILAYLERIASEPALYPARDLARTLAAAGTALGAADICAAIIITRKSQPEFDAMPVGLKRFRTLEGAFDRLDTAPPPDFADQPDIAAIATAVALDYAQFRFPERDWLARRPRLAAWRERQRGRRSLEETMPRPMA